MSKIACCGGNLALVHAGMMGHNFVDDEVPLADAPFLRLVVNSERFLLRPDQVSDGKEFVPVHTSPGHLHGQYNARFENVGCLWWSLSCLPYINLLARDGNMVRACHARQQFLKKEKKRKKEKEKKEALQGVCACLCVCVCVCVCVCARARARACVCLFLSSLLLSFLFLFFLALFLFFSPPSKTKQQQKTEMICLPNTTLIRISMQYNQQVYVCVCGGGMGGVYTILQKPFSSTVHHRSFLH